jgi:hypothetical protein
MNNRIELANLIITHLMKPEYSWMRPEGYPVLPDNNEPVRIHISTVGNIHRQIQVRNNRIHAEYFFPGNQVLIYDRLHGALLANNHLFAHGIQGNGFNERTTRSIKLTLQRGANSPREEWDDIALTSVNNMDILIHYLEPYLTAEYRRWEF